jgi:hypothetical protein
VCVAREYERGGGLGVMGLFGDAERFIEVSAGKGTAEKEFAVGAEVFDFGIDGSEDEVVVEPVGLMGLTHWGAKCMDICDDQSALVLVHV